MDLDGTLIASDLLLESAVRSVKSRAINALKIPFWLLRGRPYLKRRLSDRLSIDVASLPFRPAVVEFLQRQHASGRRLVLATASDRLLADQVADHLGIFDDRLCTDGERNLKGRAKRERIEAYCRDHGVTEFGYLGDGWADLDVWAAANEVYAVAPGAGLQAAIGRLGKPCEVVLPRGSTLVPLLRALRPQQWVKNLLLFVPLMLAHHLSDAQAVVSICLAFLAFSACASCVYVINDVMDLDADRKHPRKKRRPFASGTLPLMYAAGMIPALLAVAFGVSIAFLPLEFVALLALYLAVNLAYSTWLKRKPMIDVLLLAGMYTLRVLAGGVAVELPASEWLLAFSTFFFLSLAFVKRYSELIRLAQDDEIKAAGRSYRVSDIGLIESMGPTAGYLAVLVLALYINSDKVRELYSNVGPLWLVCALLLYWISRIWFWAKRGALNEDPVVFALTDRTSLLTGACSLALVALAAVLR